MEKKYYTNAEKIAYFEREIPRLHQVILALTARRERYMKRLQELSDPAQPENDWQDWTDSQLQEELDRRKQSK